MSLTSYAGYSTRKILKTSRCELRKRERRAGGLGWDKRRSRPLSGVFSSSSSSGADTDSPGFRVLRVAGDGNCLFRSLVQSYHAAHFSRDDVRYAPLGSEEETAKAMALRGAVCAALVDRKDFIEPFVGTGIEEYVCEMQKPSTWGGMHVFSLPFLRICSMTTALLIFIPGEPELSIASFVLRCTIVVFEPIVEANAISLSKTSEYCLVDDAVDDLKSINVLFSGGMHYDALITMS